MKLQEAKRMAALVHLEKGRRFAEEENYVEAITEFQLASVLDATLEKAAFERKKAGEQLQAEELVSDANLFYQDGRYVQAKQALSQALNLAPQNKKVLDLTEKIKRRRTIVDGYDLDVASHEPITLKFKDTQIRQVFDILSELSEINFIFDENIRQKQITVFLEKVSFAQALEMVLNLHNLGKKVLNSKTILVFEKKGEKDKQLTDHIIQIFYLSNIDAKKMVNLLRTMLLLRKISVHEDRNALIIRDNPDVIRLAQQIIEAADRPDSEVVFDLELIEVGHTDDFNIGLLLSDYSISAGLAQKGDDSIVTGTMAPDGSTKRLTTNLSGLQTFYTLPNATFSFAKNLSDSEILASPKIRVKNNAKAKVHVGTREPVITVTVNGDSLSDNVQYVDVGVKLNVEPIIQLDDSVVTILGLEVSSVSNRTTTERGTQVLTITTTNAESSLTLKDGQQTVIGGLIRDEYIKSKVTIPFIGRLPLIGDLFSSNVSKKTKREILLSITPHIVKNIDIPRSNVATIWSGGEEDLRSGPKFGSFAPSFVPELDMVPPAAAPSLVESRQYEFEPEEPAPAEPISAEPTSYQPDLDQPNLDQPNLDQPNLDQPDLDQPDLDQPDLDQPDLDQPNLDQPDLDQPDLDQPDLDQPNLDQPDL
ncbi:secretin N-terminal domain-containing protein, partial [Trichloromonas sp.]|uniref:secretin N-terminal domain-containing protein n=1 Tax=Trichloromonas sp. TaxID=3069249 RepID=UPI003D81B604